jgi:hypothetical protein
MEQINTCDVLFHGGRKKKLDVFFSRQKSPRCSLGGGEPRSKSEKRTVQGDNPSNEEKTLQEKKNLSIELSEVNLRLVWELATLSVRL